MTLVLDSGAFLAVEKGDRDIAALLKVELSAGRAPVTHGGVVGQVWRGGAGRQVPVARLLSATDVVALDDGMGRRVGILLGKARKSDAIDAAVVLLAVDGDMVLTADANDLRRLAESAAVHVDIVPV